MEAMGNTWIRDTVSLVEDEGLVWRRVADIQSMPSYWTEIKAVRVLGTDGTMVQLNLDYSTGGSGPAIAMVNEPGRTLVIRFSDGPLIGVQRITVHKGELETVWDVRSGGRKGVRIDDLRIASQEGLKRLAEIHDTLA